MEDLVQQIKDAQKRLENRGRALKLLVETAERKPVQKGNMLIQRGFVQGLRDSEEGIQGTVSSETSTDTYPVRIKLHSRPNGWVVVQDHSCTCHAHSLGSGPCKHVLALAGMWLVKCAQDWKRLKRAEQALTEDLEESAA